MKIVTILLFSTILFGVEMPPAIPMLQTKAKSNDKVIDSCKLIPPMIINIPPPMEDDLIKCKNKVNKPTIEFAQKQLSKLFKKKIIVKKVQSVKKFNQLYKITYDGGEILTNKSVDAFIKQ